MGVPLPGESMIIAASIYAATTGRLNIAIVIACCRGGSDPGRTMRAI